ncbi:MAG TPA: GerMN domain-containing protein [Candidatus Onthocola stercorigallinarum]|nr:GerMN domain-containing protein [Candidatus Onthocola stercorigallinarum]
MLRKSSIRRIMLATLALFLLLIIYFFPTTPSISESLSYIEKEEMPIFLVDNMEYIARTSIVKNSDNTDDLIKEVIESLTIGSNKSNYIREGFKAVIPEGTKVLDIKLEDSILTINFSKELLNVSQDSEEKMLEAIIYSLTEIDSVKKIKILVEGEHLTNLPNSNKKIPELLDKNYGINKIYNLDSIKDTSKTTIYYLSKYNDYYYYVPVTKISNENLEKAEIIINELKTTPIYHTNLISYLAASTNLTNYEILENSISLSFDNHLLAGIDDEDMLEEVKYAISLSIRDSYGIDEVIFNISE